MMYWYGFARLQVGVDVRILNMNHTNHKVAIGTVSWKSSY
jgi:hypothetical protein